MPGIICGSPDPDVARRVAEELVLELEDSEKFPYRLAAACGCQR